MRPEVPVEWRIGPGVKCDMIGYGGVNLTGPRAPVEIYPSGFRRGTFETDKLKSVVMLAPEGVRVIFATHERGWTHGPWRCVRFVAGQGLLAEKGMWLARVPDLDWLDGPQDRKSNLEPQRGFPLVKELGEGTGWTFGHLPFGEQLGGRVQVIQVERESNPWTPEASPK
jgi:hypothetical protein